MIKLRELIASDELVVVPGVYDCITAQMVKHAGFSAAYMTGAGVAAARGYPDYGLLTATEMAQAATELAQCLSIPLIADADTGFGNEMNVTRTVRDYERGGVAAIQIEDQVAPKRCGHLEGKELIELSDFQRKIRAAVDARRSEDFLVIARTDALAVPGHGMKDALDRARASLDAGADLIFVEAPETIEEVAMIPQLVAGPCLLNIVPNGRTPDLSLKDISDMGYRLAILPGLLLVNAIEAGDRVLEGLRDRAEIPKPGLGPAQVFERMGAEFWRSIPARVQAELEATDDRGAV